MTMYYHVRGESELISGQKITGFEPGTLEHKPVSLTTEAS